MLVTTANSQVNPLFFQHVAQLDLGPIAYQLMHSQEGPVWTETQARQAIAQYRQFLYLIALYPDRILVPTQTIDYVWHCHILDTMKYAQDCQRLFGRFIHHFPYFGVRGEDDRYNWQVAVQQTQALFGEHFGREGTDQHDWLQVADCQPLGMVAECDRPC